MGGTDFFGLISEGAELVMELDENSPSFFTSLERVREILLLIGAESGPQDAGAKPSKSPALSIDLGDKDGTERALIDYIKSPEFAALPEWRKSYEALAVIELGLLVGRGYSVSGAVGEINQSESVADAAYEAYAANALPVSIDRDAVAKKVEEVRESLKAMNFPEAKPIVDERDAITKAIEDARERYAAAESRAYEARVNHGTNSHQYELAMIDMKAAAGEYDTGRAALKAFIERLESPSGSFSVARKQLIEREFADSGGKIISDMIGRSKVSDSEAVAWSGRQDISDGAKAKLKKLGYPIDAIRRDMAEFYRICGGKLPNVKVVIDGARRANAKGIESHDGHKAIAIGSRFSKSVLWHELGHQLEFDTSAKHAANAFLKRRRDGDKLYTLKSLTGANFDRDEVAWRDSWLNPYIGKMYRNGITEVFSMGMEYLADPVYAATLASKDPEMFALITGYALTEHTPAMKAKLQGNEASVSAKDQKAQTEQEAYEEAVKLLASTVTLSPIPLSEWINSVADWMRSNYYLELKFLKAVGAKRDWGGIKTAEMPEGLTVLGETESGMTILSGRMKKASGRVGKAFMGLWASNAHTQGGYEVRDVMRVFDSLDEAKAWPATYAAIGTKHYSNGNIIAAAKQIRGEQ